MIESVDCSNSSRYFKLRQCKIMDFSIKFISEFRGSKKMNHFRFNLRIFINDLLIRILIPALPSLLLSLVIGLVVWSYYRFGLTFFVGEFSTEESGLRFTLDLALKAFLFFAVLQLYILALGLSVDKLWAKYVVRKHVVIVAGSEGVTQESDAIRSPISALLNLQNRYEDRQKAAIAGLATSFLTAVDFARSISLSDESVSQGMGRTARSSGGKGGLFRNLRSVFSTKVVFSAPVIPQSDRQLLWRAGVCVVEGGYSVDELFIAVGADRASAVYVMRDDPAEAVKYTQLFLRKKGDLEVRSLIEPYDLRFKLMEEHLFHKNDMYRLRFFNESELIARAILKEYPPEGNRLNSEPVHVLLIGMGSVGKALILHLARIGQFRSQTPLSLTVISLDAEKAVKELQASNNCFNDLNHRCPRLKGINSDFFEISDRSLEKIMHRDSSQWSSLSSIYVCIKNEFTNLRVAKILDSMRDPTAILKAPLLASSIPIVVLDPPGGTLLEAGGFDSSHGGGVKIFSLTRRAAEPHVARKGRVSIEVTNSLESVPMYHWSTDRLDVFFDDNEAQFYHNTYIASEAKVGNIVNPSDWKDLDESMRESNRYRKDFLPVFLRALGLQEVLQDDDRLGVDWEALTLSEQRLAEELEHNFWWQGRILSGWKKIPVPVGEGTDEAEKIRDQREKMALAKVRKEHWLLIPYSEIVVNEGLIDPIKEIEKDRGQIRAMFSRVSDRGAKLVRIGMST